MTHNARMAADRELVERQLQGYFTGPGAPERLLESMRYSLLGGGKRIRPILTLAFCRACGGEAEAALPFACAVEMVHTYSLIHDDLPCMDNDDYRRGRLTSHKIYGEAGATLAGDALLTAAFETMLAAGEALPPERALSAALCLAEAAGERGMVGGQVLDMAGEGKPLSDRELREIHTRKTGAMIRAAAEIGCIVAGASPAQREAAVRYADKVGFAFQVRDDVLDITGDEKTLGKKTGSDAANGKTTFATLYGPEGCAHLIEAETREAIDALSVFPDAGYLRYLAEYMAGREN